MNNRGFTLIELAVVVFLVGTVMFLAVPTIRETFVADPMKTSVNRIVNTARDLAIEAMREQVDTLLHLDIDRGKLWTTSADMTPEAIRDQKETSFQLPEDVRIVDIYRFGRDKVNEGEATIRFYSRGYRDPTVMHLAWADQSLTLIFEPFLPGVDVREGYLDPEF